MLRKVFGTIFFCVATLASAEGLKVTSTAIKAGADIGAAQVYNSFGCTGQNVSPDLQWTGAPKDTKFFAVTMYDPDAPTGSGWWHWLLFNIPASVTSLAAGVGSKDGKLPEGSVQSRTDFGTAGYGGPCPPAGTPAHRYLFKVYALKDKIPVGEDATAAMIGFYANQLKLAEGSLEAKFGRK